MTDPNATSSAPHPSDDAPADDLFARLRFHLSAALDEVSGPWASMSDAEFSRTLYVRVRTLTDDLQSARDQLSRIKKVLAEDAGDPISPREVRENLRGTVGSPPCE